VPLILAWLRLGNFDEVNLQLLLAISLGEIESHAQVALLEMHLELHLGVELFRAITYEPWKLQDALLE